MSGPRCAVLPAGQQPALVEAVEAGGGTAVAADEAEALIWTDPRDPEGLGATLDAHEGIRWVQLPFAGIEPFVHLLDDRTWTCGKGVYAEPVAEHALALLLGGMRGVGRYARQRTWSAPYGSNLLGAHVAILGGGAITTSLVRLLGPFGTRATVVRNRLEPMQGVDAVVGTDRLHAVLARADAVVLALALTPRTERIIDSAALDAMQEHAWLVNVARGRHVDTVALVDALADERIGGAALDVTDPEPLPDGHALWSSPRALITPHIANTPEMGLALLWERVRENVARYRAGEELLGPVHVELGY